MFLNLLHSKPIVCASSNGRCMWCDVISPDGIDIDQSAPTPSLRALIRLVMVMTGASASRCFSYTHHVLLQSDTALPAAVHHFDPAECNPTTAGRFRHPSSASR